MRTKFFSSIIEQIKFKMRRPKAQKREMPILTWEELEEDGQEEVLQQVQEQAEEEIERLNEAIRGRN